MSWKNDNADKNEDGSIIPIASKESEAKVYSGEITVTITFHRQRQRPDNSLKKLLNLNHNLKLKHESRRE